MKKTKLQEIKEFFELLGMASLLPVLTVLIVVITFGEYLHSYFKFVRKSKLIKNVCKNCYVRCSVGWNPSNDEDWKNGELTCQFSERYGKIKTKDGPPEACPYALEHLMK